MSEGTKTCPSCRQVNGAEAKFCGACGTALTGIAIDAPPTPASKVANRTMLGLSMESLPGADTSKTIVDSSPYGETAQKIQEAVARAQAAALPSSPMTTAPVGGAAAAVPSTSSGKPQMKTMVGGFDWGQAGAPVMPAAAPQAMATHQGAQGFAPQPVAPQAPLAPQPIASQPIVHQALAPQPFAPQAAEPLAHQPMQPQALAQQPPAQQPLSQPQPLAPQPLAPQPLAQQALAPQQPQPLAPQQLAPQPLAPQPLVQQALAPQQPQPLAQQPLAQQPQQPPVAPQAPPSSGKPAQRTMLGMAAPDLSAIAAQVRAQAAPEPPNATIQGMPTPGATPASAAAAIVGAPLPDATAVPPAATPVPEPMAAAPAQGQKKPAIGASNRTMLGVAAPAQQAVQAAMEAAERQRQEEAQRASHAYAQQQPGAMPPPQAAMATGELSIAGLPSPARRRSNAPIIALLLFGLLFAIVGVSALAWVLTHGSSHAVRPTVVQGESGEQLSIEVPGAVDGTRVRFSGQEQPLAAGVARFPLTADSLHVGDNELTIDVVAPDGSVETERVTLTLELRVRADLTTLTATPPAITVVIEAVPGSSAQLDGAAVTLDAQGRGTRAYPIDSMTPNAEGLVVHTAHYAITPPGGAAAQGDLTTRVPLTTVQIDRPRDGAVTDRDAVEIAGAVQPGASVTVDGAAITVGAEGRFLHRLALPQPGEVSARIVATAPGKAPTVRMLRVRRVEDLAREAASFQADASITYARLASGPATFQGQRVSFTGRVYNVDTGGTEGGGVLQMLVLDCQTDRCPLWVTYAAAQEITVGSTVRVLGTVAGEQQFRSQAGEVRTVPRVDATFVIPQ